MKINNFSLLLLPILLILSLNSLSYAATDIYTSFIQCLSSKSDPNDQIIYYTPHNKSFASVLQSRIKNLRFNTSTTPKPKIIITPKTECHVQDTVICAKNYGILLRIRSGGHDYEGMSYVSDQDFVVLDMFNLNSVEINMNDETAWVGVGATLGELYYNIWKNSEVHGFPAGVCPTVGVGGHLSGGGYGALMRKYGLSVDNVIDARIIDVNGRVLDKNAMGEDLFWAIRGGGGASFGVVTSYKIRLVRVPATMTVFRVRKTLDENATDAVHKWQSIAATIDNDLFIRVIVEPVTAKDNRTKTIRASFNAMFLGDSQRLVSLLTKEFPELGLKIHDCRQTNWINSILYWADFDNSTEPEELLSKNKKRVDFLKRKSDYVQKPISKEGFNSIWKKIIELGKIGVAFNPYGGRMGEIPSDATPFPHRAGNIFKIQYFVNWNKEDSKTDNDYLNQARSLYSYMTPFVSKSPRSAFLNYRDLDIGITTHGKDSYDEGLVYGRKYFKGNFERLVNVKTAVDPDNFFKNQQSIPTAPWTEKEKLV